MFFSRPIQRYHSHADPIWPDGTFNDSVLRLSQGQNMEKLKSSVLVHGLVGGIKSGPKTPAWISLHFL
jgi:hypothetical protein